MWRIDFSKQAKVYVSIPVYVPIILLAAGRTDRSNVYLRQLGSFRRSAALFLACLRLVDSGAETVKSADAPTNIHTPEA